MSTARGKGTASGSRRPAVRRSRYEWPVDTWRPDKEDGGRHAPKRPPAPARPPVKSPPVKSPHDRAPSVPHDGAHDRLPPPPDRCSGTLHQVRAGDTIFRLSLAHGVSMEAILAANPQITDPDRLVQGQLLCIPAATDDMLVILNALLTAEKVETALYARGLQSPALSGLPPEQFAYFQAGLSHEIAHIEVLEDLGASIPNRVFFYPPGAFEDLSIYVNTLLTLETAGVSAYIQASDEFARMGRFDLSRLMDQIMGVEAEHRALLREVLDLIPAANLCFERAPDQPVTEILAALPAFLQPNQFDGASTGPVPLPTPEEAADLIGPNGCPNPRPDL